MARKYGNIFTAIWRDRDFLALPSSVQRVYLIAITQPDVSSCGLLPLMPSRWAKYAPDTDTDSLWDALSILHAKRYLIADSATDELLIRSFIRYDGGYGNGKRLPAILAAIEGILSDTLRQVTVHELDRLGVEHRLSDSPLDSLSDSLLDRLWHTPRIPVTLRTKNLNPETGSLNPETGSSSEAASASVRPEVQDLLDLLDAEMERNGQKPNGHLKRNGDAMRLLIDRDGHDADDIARIIRWCQADEFWRTNILSASKLRDKFGQLSAKASRAAVADLYAVPSQPWTPPPGSPLSYVEM